MTNKAKKLVDALLPVIQDLYRPGKNIDRNVLPDGTIHEKLNKQTEKKFKSHKQYKNIKKLFDEL